MSAVNYFKKTEFMNVLRSIVSFVPGLLLVKGYCQSTASV